MWMSFGVGQRFQGFIRYPNDAPCEQVVGSGENSICHRSQPEQFVVWDKADAARGDPVPLHEYTIQC